MSGTLVVGIGNPVRGDDGAGREVARRLRQSGIEGAAVVESDGDITGILQAFEGQTRCILVDASRSGRQPGTIQRFETNAQPLPASLGTGSTHALGLADAIEVARALGQLPAVVVVYTIEGRSYWPGDTLSGPVRRAVEVAERRIRAEIHQTGMMSGHPQENLSALPQGATGARVHDGIVVGAKELRLRRVALRL